MKPTRIFLYALSVSAVLCVAASCADATPQQTEPFSYGTSEYLHVDDPQSASDAGESTWIFSLPPVDETTSDETTADITDETSPDPTVDPTSEPSEPTSDPTSEPSVEPIDVVQVEMRALLAKEEPDLATPDFLPLLRTLATERDLRDLLQAAEQGYSSDLWREYTGNSIHVLRALYKNEPELSPYMTLKSVGKRGQSKDTTLIFGGDMCFADTPVPGNPSYLMPVQNMLKKNLTVAECISEPFLALLQDSDVTVLNNEFAISDRGSPMNGKTWAFRAQTVHTALYNQMGVDLVSLANNHAFDYGKDAFCDTLDTLRSFGIAYVGGGRDASEAQSPYYFLVDGRKIAFVSATRAEKNIMTPEATETEPGVFRCYDTKRLKQVLKETKEQCDYVVLLIHWGKEQYTDLEAVQINTAPEYIDSGADLIIGGHAHKVQGIGAYKNKAIFYNLGNFWFDSYNKETALVRVTLSPDGTETFHLFPGWTKNCLTTYELGTSKGKTVIDQVVNGSTAAVSIDPQTGLVSFG